jgi:hypothetical protein
MTSTAYGQQTGTDTETSVSGAAAILRQPCLLEEERPMECQPDDSKSCSPAEIQPQWLWLLLLGALVLYALTYCVTYCHEGA